MVEHLCHLSSDHLSLAVAPLGAEMQYLRTRSGEDLLWHGDAAFWSGRAPVLYPIVGRAVDDTVESGGRRAKMKQHGFARRMAFDAQEATSDRCQHVLRSSESTREVYPFEFQLTITHEIKDATLVVGAEVANTSTEPMPFGFGFHPAFCLPLPGAGADHFVWLKSGGSPKQRVLRPDGLLQPSLTPGPFESGKLAITEPLFENGALIFPDGSEPLRFGPQDGPFLDFEFENLPDFALWRPVGAPFLCVEPWRGTASIVGDGPDIAKRPNSTVLDAGATMAFGYRVAYSA